MRLTIWFGAGLALLGCAAGVFAQGGVRPAGPPPLDDTDPACRATVLASTGGAFPKNPRTLAVRWTGYSNFELAYNGEILLLDAYFDRGRIYPPIGFKAADVKNVSGLLIGHGHFDHMSDAASIAIRTGAMVVGAPVTIEKLKTQYVDPKQLRTVTGRGGETLRIGGFTIEPILGRHGEPPDDVTAAFNGALQSITSAITLDEANEQSTIRARGTSDPRVLAEGTIAYVITLENGFRIAYRDSGGAVTEQERAAFKRLGRVDLALAATSAAYLNRLTIEQALEYVHTYNPGAFMPAHHDAPYNGLWRATEPIFQAIKTENPNIVTISKGYREPTCFVTGR
jgi:L-ascorbate metabolism protein UlaG (beta-lactamase superfamily)